MLRICFVIVSLLLHSVVTAQNDSIDVSSLPKASYTKEFSSVDRWGEMLGNVITVGFQQTKDASPLLIETVLEEDKATYIIFPSGGTETDIFIYKINGQDGNNFDIDYTTLKENVFMLGDEPKEQAIQIDDLGSGYYYVSYISCNYARSYVLHLKVK